MKKLYSSIDKREQQLASGEEDTKITRQKRKGVKAKETLVLPASQTNEELLNIRVEQLLRFDGQAGNIPQDVMIKHSQRLRSKPSSIVRIGNSRSSSSMIKQKVERTVTKSMKLKEEKVKKAKSLRDLAKKLKKEFKK